MKIAVQISGHLRTFEKCAPTLKEHLLEQYDCDVFIHTWSQTEHETKSWYDNSAKSTLQPVEDNILSAINKFYSPKSIKIETQNLFQETGYFGTHNKVKISLQGVKYMTYGQYQANKLREAYEQENAVNYDYVVVIRPDIMLFAKLDFDLYKKEFSFFKDICIHFVHNPEVNKVLSKKVINFPLIADCYFFSTPHIISKITRLFEEFDFYFKEINSILPPQMDSPETAFFEYIHQKGIITRLYINYFALKRNDDKNDIKLLPPQKINDEKLAKKKEAAKVILRFISKNSSISVRCKLIKIFNYFGICGAYMQALEQTLERTK